MIKSTILITSFHNRLDWLCKVLRFFMRMWCVYVRSPLFSFILKSLFIGNSYLSWYCCFVLFVFFLQKFKNMVDLHNVSFFPRLIWGLLLGLLEQCFPSSSLDSFQGNIKLCPFKTQNTFLSYKLQPVILWYISLVLLCP